MYAGAGDSEFAFEMQVCRWAELAWHPTEGDRPVIVARQLGTSDRRWDTVVIEVDQSAFSDRRAVSDDGLDRDLIRVVQHAPTEYAWYRDAMPDPGFPWAYVRAAIHRAADRDLVETRRGDGGRIEMRQTRPYPDWIDRVIAIENKPDLTASAADRLAEQLAHDVSAGLLDEAWIATDAERGRRVLLSEFPDEAGVLAFDFSDGVHREAADVLWHPSRLDPDPPVAGPDEYPEANPTRREELAERAYEQGWRPADTTRPDCRAYKLRRVGRGLLPYCTAKECHQTSSECSGDCPSFAPEPPAWRTKGPPIDGGPGKAIQRLLDRRRQRVREMIGDE